MRYQIKKQNTQRVGLNKIESEQKSLPKNQIICEKIKSTKCLSNQQSDKTINPNISALATITKFTNNHQ